MNLKEWRIYSDLIPHSEFHKGYWLSINESNPWYYFFPTQRTYELPSNPDFYKTLDKDLKGVVALLHKNEIPTTPSCSGHFFGPEHYSKIYRRLEQNTEKIKSEGVILENSETGVEYYYRNVGYELPWSLDHFVSKSLDYQKTGVLGFVDPSQTLKEIIPSDFKIIQDNDITIILEISQDEEEKKLKWNKLYESLTRYLLP